MARKLITKSIILQGRNYGEADKIMIAFTKDYGRIDFLARGVRKMKSKNRALVQPFTYSELEFIEGKNLDILTQGVLIESFSHIRTDFDKIIECSYMAEYLIQVLQPHDPYEQLCYQFLWTLNYIDKKRPKNKIAMLAFLIKSFDVLGYAPLMDICLECGRSIEKHESFQYLVSEGSVACNQCSSGKGFFMNQEMVQLYRFLQTMDFKTATLPTENNNLIKRMEQLVEKMMMQILEREHKSTAFLKKMKDLSI